MAGHKSCGCIPWRITRRDRATEQIPQPFDEPPKPEYQCGCIPVRNKWQCMTLAPRYQDQPTDELRHENPGLRVLQPAEELGHEDSELHDGLNLEGQDNCECCFADQLVKSWPSCNHKICEGCIQKHLVNRMQEQSASTLVTCPIKRCDIVNPAEVCFKFLPREVCLKWIQAIRESRQQLWNRNRDFCRCCNSDKQLESWPGCNHILCMDCIQHHLLYMMKEQCAAVKCPVLNCSLSVPAHMCCQFLLEEVGSLWIKAIKESQHIDNAHVAVNIGHFAISDHMKDSLRGCCINPPLNDIIESLLLKVDTLLKDRVDSLLLKVDRESFQEKTERGTKIVRASIHFIDKIKEVRQSPYPTVMSILLI